MMVQMTGARRYVTNMRLNMRISGYFILKTKVFRMRETMDYPMPGASTYISWILMTYLHRICMKSSAML